MTSLIVIVVVCLVLFTLLSYCKQDSAWVNRKTTGYQPHSAMRMRIRVWNYETDLTAPDPWLQPVYEPVVGPATARIRRYLNKAV